MDLWLNHSDYVRRNDSYEYTLDILEIFSNWFLIDVYNNYLIYIQFNFEKKKEDFSNVWLLFIIAMWKEETKLLTIILLKIEITRAKYKKY